MSKKLEAAKALLELENLRKFVKSEDVARRARASNRLTRRQIQAGIVVGLEEVTP